VADPRALRLGTRGSPLALWQARTVAARIAEHDGPSTATVVIKTTGDRLTEVRLSEHGGKGLFVKELEDALLSGAIDAAVHSSKDLAAVVPSGLTIAATLPREDPRDALVLPASHGVTVSRWEELAEALGSGRVVGTGSIRRVVQMQRALPAARFEPVRGNLDTRLRKLDAGEYDALVLAAAGLRRLGLGHRIALLVPVDICIPAPGQGIVAVEAREDDARTLEALVPIDDGAASVALAAERAVVAALGGGCQIPLGALATRLSGGDLEVVAMVASRDGHRRVHAAVRGSAADPGALGRQVAARLLADGAGDILAQ